MAEQTDGPPLAAPTASSGVLPDKWPTQVADAIVDVVGQVHDRTTGPAITVARGVVFGLLGAVLGTVALVMVIIFAIRILNVYIPGDVWIVYLGLGVLATIAGCFAWSKAFSQAPADTL